MITLKDFFYGCFKNSDLQNLLRIYNLSINGTKEELIERILDNKLPNLKEYLLYNFNKSALQSIAVMWEIKSSGTKEEIKERILENINFPKKFQKEYHFTQIDNKNGTVVTQNITAEFLLDRYFSKEDLKEFLKSNQFPVSGNIEELKERIVKNIKPDLIYMLNYLYSTDIDDLCILLNIKAKGKKQDKIDLILSRLNINDSELPKKNDSIKPTIKDNNFKKKCREMIGKDNLDAVFSSLLSYTETCNSSIHNDIIILQNQWITLCKDRLLNNHNHQDLSIRKNQILKSLVSILDSLD